MPRISVLMPVRNGEATLDVAVRSTLRALSSDAELLVLDDGSTDGTAEVLSRIGDVRLRVLTNSSPGGVGAGLRSLVAATDSEFVGRMDADDVTLPGRFAHQIRALRRGADFCFSSIVRFRTAPTRLRPGLPVAISPEAMPFHMLVHNPLCHPTMVCTRDAVLAAGSYRAVRAEDHDLWLRALTAGLRMTRLATPLLAYRQHEGQISGDPTFALAALNEREFQDAYAALARRVLGVEPTWLELLWPERAVDTATRVLVLSEFRALLEARATRLGSVQRRLFDRSIRHLGG